MASPVFFSQPPASLTVISLLHGIKIAVEGSYKTLANPLLCSALRILLWRLGRLLIFGGLLYSLAAVPSWILGGTINFLSWLNLVSAENASLLADTLRFVRFGLLNEMPFLVMLTRYLSPRPERMFWSTMRRSDPKVANRLLNTNYHFASDGFVTNRHKSAAFLWVNQLVKRIRRKLALQDADDSVLVRFVVKYLENSCKVLFMYASSQIPYVGAAVLPFAIFSLLSESTGTLLGTIAGCIALLCSKEICINAIWTFLGVRQLAQFLVAPYMHRLPFTNPQKCSWYQTRLGCLFGFTSCFYCAIAYSPLLISLLALVVAQGATAVLISEVTDAPPVLRISKQMARRPLTTRRGLLLSMSSSDRLSDLKLITQWTEIESEWSQPYQEEMDAVFGDLDSMISGAYVNTHTKKRIKVPKVATLR